MKPKDTFPEYVSLSFAEKKMLNSISKSPGYKKINIKDCENRILAEDIISNVDIPEENNSAVDGYAIDNNFFKKNIKYKIINESKPGKPYLKKVKQNQAIKIYTGAYILKKNKINTVIMEEQCTIKDGFVTFDKKIKTGSNVRSKGEDIKNGTILFEKGRKLKIPDIAQILSTGINKIRVYNKPKVGIFSTGDEISELNIKKGKYQIYDVNKFILTSMFKKMGCEVLDLGIIKDNYESTKNLMLKNHNLDILVTSGGVSKSSTDNVSKLMINYGKLLFWRIKIKPGRPFAFGKIKNTIFIGFPGNPVAVAVTFLMLVTKFIKKLSGNSNFQNKPLLIPSNFSMKKKKDRVEWLRGSILLLNKKTVLKKFYTTGSGIISSLTQSEGIIEIDSKTENVKKGRLLKFFKFEDLLS